MCTVFICVYVLHCHSNRVRQSQRLLQTTIEDSRRAGMRLMTANERLGGLNGEVDSLAMRIAALSTECECISL
jgi:hypothetical protein